jgi:acetylornithine/succinyldiaminopimelate/putrescine aminotransferase
MNLKIVSREVQELADRLNCSLRERTSMSPAAMVAVREDGLFVGIDLGDRDSGDCPSLVFIRRYFLRQTVSSRQFTVARFADEAARGSLPIGSFHP